MKNKPQHPAFDPNGPAAADSGIFGLTCTPAESEVVLVPVPWEVTTSYGGGTARGPQAILQASHQVDLFHPGFPGLWRRGIAMDEWPEALLEQSTALKKDAALVIAALTEGAHGKPRAKARKALERINTECATMNEWVERRCTYWLERGKRVGLVGGDHSTPLGLFRALARRHKNFGILHIDAHLDLRKAYEGFAFSHASIMYNALGLKALSRIVSVGIRDFCEEENALIARHPGRLKVALSADIRRQQFEGVTWREQCDALIEVLPQHVHISLDIDGLDPSLCPNTGTPVPGGLQFEEVTYLLTRVARQRTVIGFDLVEVSPGEAKPAKAAVDAWDANVGARMLWHLCGVLAGG